MGKEKQVPGNSGKILREKRLLAFLVVLIASITFGLVLQGCQSPTVVEKSKCGDNKDDYVSPLSGLDDEIYQVIKAEICIPEGEGKYTVETAGLDEDQIKLAKEVQSPFPISRLVTYFQVKDVNGKLITDFDPPLELRVEYTDKVWVNATDRDSERPRLAYLVLKDNVWADAWVEFSAENIKVIPPGTEGYPEDRGYLNITIEKLSDPLIGGL